jgi:two-component system chemotaxis response regulator CheB
MEPAPAASPQNIRAKTQKSAKLLIVDDSRLLRKGLRKLFEADPKIEIVGEADNGRMALAYLPRLSPDVITLDINMPEMDGLTTLKHIMIKHPTPTVMLSSLTREGATKSFDALRLGAIDFITKPSQRDPENFAGQATAICQKIRQASEVEIKNIRLFRSQPPLSKATHPTLIKHCIVLGASEGGYRPLLKIIPQLKPEWTAAYLVVLHVDPEYVDAFVDYLDDYSQIPVKRAVDGSLIEGGCCYLAAGSDYITAIRDGNRLMLRVHPSPFPGRRGAINMLMFSLSETLGNRTIGVILSGRGNDGAEGAAEIKRVGGNIIIQSPATCMFREMPQAVIHLSGSAQIMPAVNIAETIGNICLEP